MEAAIHVHGQCHGFLLHSKGNELYRERDEIALHSANPLDTFLGLRFTRPYSVSAK